MGSFTQENWKRTWMLEVSFPGEKERNFIFEMVGKCPGNRNPSSDETYRKTTG